MFIGGNETAGHPIVTKPENADQYDNSSVKKFANSFKGKKVGVCRMYTSELVWKAVLEEQGIDTSKNSKDLEVVEFKKDTDLVAAVSAGQVDVGVINQGNYTQAVDSGLKVVGFSQDLWPNHVCCRIVASKDYYDKNKDALARLLKALLRGQKAIEADQDYEVKLNADRVGISIDKARDLLVKTGVVWDTDPNRKGILKFYDAMEKQGLIDNKIDMDSYIDVSLYQEAIEELVNEHPNDKFYANQLKKFKKQNLD